VLGLRLAGRDRLVTAPALPAAGATSFLAAECVRRDAAASVTARGVAAVGSIAIMASQYEAATAAFGTAAALDAAAALFPEAAVAAVAIAAAGPSLYPIWRRGDVSRLAGCPFISTLHTGGG
jgi:hypothetical protein